MQKEISWLLKEKYQGKPTAKFQQDVRRLKMGEPVDYVIGFTEFLGCKIDLSKKPLIPRPETEYWVQKATEDIYSDFNGREKRSIRVLDMFAGSGCIGVSIMRQIKNATLTFVEKEKNFLEQIKINIKINYSLIRTNKRIDNKKRHHVVQSDVFSNIKGRYDYIFANPPYIPTTQKNNIQKSVLQYEPKMALFGGKDGLFYIRKFLAEAKNFLNQNGKIYMEFDPPQKPGIEKLLKKYGYNHWEFRKDQYGKFRYVIICD